jgi:hypothetical protein
LRFRRRLWSQLSEVPLAAAHLLPVTHARHPVVVVRIDDAGSQIALDEVGFFGLEFFVDLAAAGETECGFHRRCVSRRMF